MRFTAAFVLAPRGRGGVARGVKEVLGCRDTPQKEGAETTRLVDGWGGGAERQRWME